MIKYLFFLFSTFGFLVVNLFSDENVEITHNIPSYLVAGKSYNVDFVIKKGAITGFAKFQIELPDGLSIRAIETQGSSFTFKEHVVKNIWMKIPETPEITLSYQVEVGSNLEGTGDIKARFVYIKDNERFTVGMESFSVDIGDGSGVIVAGETTSVADKNISISSNRVVNKLGENEFEVIVEIDKDGLEGFAKVQDILPVGFDVRPLRTSKSVFSVVDDKIKFIWFNVPPEQKITVSYLLTANEIAQPGESIRGTFNYIENDEAREIDIESKEIPLDKAIVAAVAATTVAKVNTEPTPPAITEETVIEEPPVVVVVVKEEPPVVIEEVVKEEPLVVVAEVVKEEPPVVEEIIIEQEPVIPEPQGEVFYRVQLAAGKKNVNIDYIKKKYGYNQSIFLENHEGWFKYTSGNYSKYVEARNRREEIKREYKFRGPFVTAYNAGERITVQEALLISKQKWVK